MVGGTKCLNNIVKSWEYCRVLRQVEYALRNRSKFRETNGVMDLGKLRNREVSRLSNPGRL